MHLERLLRQHKHELPAQKRVLEINPSHDLTRALAKMVGQKGATEALEDAAYLLMDQALILEGEPVPDPTAFTKRLSDWCRARWRTDGSALPALPVSPGRARPSPRP